MFQGYVGKFLENWHLARDFHSSTPGEMCNFTVCENCSTKVGQATAMLNENTVRQREDWIPKRPFFHGNLRGPGTQCHVLPQEIAIRDY